MNALTKILAGKHMYGICLLCAFAIQIQVQIGHSIGAWPAIWFSFIVATLGAIMFVTYVLVLVFKIDLQEPWLMLSSGLAGLMAMMTQSASLLLMFHPNELDKYLTVYAIAKFLSWILAVAVVGGLVKSSIDGTPKKVTS